MNIGDRFTRLTVLEVGLRKYRKRAVRVRCDCGVERVLPERHLVTGNTTSCGCRHREVSRDQIVRLSTKHGNAKRGGWSGAYTSWSSMVQRCTNTDDPNWPSYGGRGITVCERWMHFPFFLADMGERPKGTTLDRRDNDKGYSPENCRWATPATQRKNQRRGVKLTDGQVALIRSISDDNKTVAARFGVSRSYINRIRRGEKRKAG